MINQEIKKTIIKQINEIREYPIPDNSSLTAKEWLNIIPENKDDKNKNIVNDNMLLSNLVSLNYIKKNFKGNGYVPQKKYFDSQLFDVRENYRTSNDSNLIQTCTVLFTPKAQEELKSIVLKLIEMKNNK